MFPTAPTGYTPPPPATQPAADPKGSPTGAEPPAAPRPELGAQAVSQLDEAAKVSLYGPGAPEDVPDIPPDPPPVKGLGIPPLNTLQVGDQDEIPDPPPKAMDDLLGAMQPPAPNGMDVRV